MITSQINLEIKFPKEYGGETRTHVINILEPYNSPPVGGRFEFLSYIETERHAFSGEIVSSSNGLFEVRGPEGLGQIFATEIKVDLDTHIRLPDEPEKQNQTIYIINDGVVRDLQFNQPFNPIRIGESFIWHESSPDGSTTFDLEVESIVTTLVHTGEYPVSDRYLNHTIHVSGDIID